MASSMTIDDQVTRLAAGGDRAGAFELAQLGAEAVRAIGRAYTAGWRTRITIGTMLRMFHDPDAVEALAELARSDNGRLSYAAIAALGHSGEPAALAPLRELLGPKTCIRVAPALGELGLPEAAPALAKLLGSDQLRDWGEAAIAAALARLGAIGSDDAERILIRAIGSENVAASVDALRGLAWRGTRHAVAALVRATTSSDAEIVDEAVDALGRWGLPAVVPVLLAVSERSPPHTHKVRRALRSMAGDAIALTADHARMTAWWERDRHLYPIDQHIWWGGRDRVHAISLIPTPQGGIARDCLELWTGIDFVDNDAPNGEGNEHDRDRALAWSHDAPRWRDGALYRRGVEVDPAPILEALRSG